jgi:hypothetical protein
MADHLWTDGPPPPEYVDLILCRDVYHCTPAELDEQEAARVQAHMLCLEMEVKVAKQREKNAGR